MPAAAFQPLQPEDDFVSPSPTAQNPAPSPVNNPASPPNSTASDDLEWGAVAPYVERFTGGRPAAEGVGRRKSRKRHRPFEFSWSVVAGALVFCELMGLIWVYALDLSALRQEDALKKNIQQTSLKIALNQNRLASYKSSPLLTQWASQLGYRPIEAGDFDDVTSSAPMPAPTPVKKETQP